MSEVVEGGGNGEWKEEKNNPHREREQKKSSKA